MCSFRLYSKGIRLYAYMHFFMLFSTVVYHRILNIVPVLYSRTLLFIHLICNSLRLLTPNSQCFPPLPPLLLATTSLFSNVHDSVCFTDRFICVMVQIPHLRTSCGICLSLSSALPLFCDTLSPGFCSPLPLTRLLMSLVLSVSFLSIRH